MQPPPVIPAYAGISQIDGGNNGDSGFRRNDGAFCGNDENDGAFCGNDERGGNLLFVIALKGRPVHSTGQRPVTALPINQALKGRPILLQGKARQNRKSKTPPVMTFAAVVFGRPFRACLFNTPIHGALPRAVNRSPFQGFYNAPLSRRWFRRFPLSRE